MLQPPLSTGSFDVRRVISVPQSFACKFDVEPGLAQQLLRDQRLPCTIGWSVADISTIFSPL